MSFKSLMLVTVCEVQDGNIAFQCIKNLTHFETLAEWTRNLSYRAYLEKKKAIQLAREISYLQRIIAQKCLLGCQTPLEWPLQAVSSVTAFWLEIDAVFWRLWLFIWPSSQKYWSALYHCLAPHQNGARVIWNPNSIMPLLHKSQ